MASCGPRIKVRHAFQWWNLENSVFVFSFSLILGRQKCEALKCELLSSWLFQRFKLCHLTSREALRGCWSWTLLLLLSSFTNYTVKRINSWGSPRIHSCSVSSSIKTQLSVSDSLTWELRPCSESDRDEGCTLASEKEASPDIPPHSSEEASENKDALEPMPSLGSSNAARRPPSWRGAPGANPGCGGPGVRAVVWESLPGRKAGSFRNGTGSRKAPVAS